jgi:TolA-binding protein
MNTEHQNNERKGRSWLRLGLLTFTLAGPVVNTVAEGIRQSSQALRRKATTLQENAQTIQATARQRLDQLTQESRKRIAEQEKQLKQLRSQARRLRKSLRKNVRQRRKLVKKLRRSGAEWSQEIFKRGQHLLQPRRKQNRNFWAMIGFGVGLVAAGVTTYLFVRRQVVQQQETDESQPIELPENGSWNGTFDASQSNSESRPAGEILLVDDIETGAVSLPVVDVEQMQRPADAAFVGVASTRFYYPVDTPLEAIDLVYFVSEEEARAQGFTAAQ